MADGSFFKGVVVVAVIGIVLYSIGVFDEETAPNTQAQQSAPAQTYTTEPPLDSGISETSKTTGDEDIFDGIINGIADAVGINTYSEGDCDLILDFDFEANLIFATDDLDLYIDNQKFYALEHGEESTYIIKTVPGKHTIKVAHGLVSASKEIDLKKTGDAFLFKIKNHTGSIDLSLTNSANLYDLTGYDPTGT